MLCKMAMGNLRRSFSHYWAYFLSAAFSAFVLYLFWSVIYGEVGRSVANRSTGAVFSIGAVLAAIFTVFFIWYSNSFFVKTRKKEFATYMLLGMSKGQTVRLCLLENLAILALAYAAGIAAGILLNKLLVMLLLHIIEVRREVPFEINGQALRTCSFIYLGVLVLISLNSVRLLRRNSLVELMTASRQAERVLRVSPLTWILAAVSLALLGGAYYMSVFMPVNPGLWMVLVALVCAGSGLLFTSVGSLYLHFARRNRRKLYRGARLITVSQLMHRYQGNVGLLTVIAITTSVALCAVLSCCGLFAKVEENSRSMRPFSVEYLRTGDDADALFARTLEAHPGNSVTARVEVRLVKALSQPEDTGAQPYYLVAQSVYNEAMEALGRSPVNVTSAEQAVLVRYGKSPEIASVSVGAGDLSREFQIAGTQNQVFISLDHFLLTLVVSDGVYEEFAAAADESERIGFTEILLADDYDRDFIADLQQALPKENRLKTFYDHYADGLQLMGVMMFVGVFVGLLFVAATGGILYFRMSTEAHEDREKYIVLSKLGVSSRELHGAVARQLAVIFGAPLALAVLNTFAALFQLEGVVNLYNASMKGVFVAVVAVYALCYAIYYRLTLGKYLRTVSRYAQ